MMRANLLPRPRVTIDLFGFALDSDHFRTALFGCVVVLAVSLIGYGIERIRLHRLESLALQSEVTFSASATRRAETKSLALEVARYQEFAREARSLRRSGPDAVIEIARIGNSVPSHVWLESLNREMRGYRVAGRSQSVDSLSGTILSLGRALPGAGASVIDIDNRAADGEGTIFSAKLSTPEAGTVDATRIQEPAGQAP